ncbi:MAG: hypothetical protein H6936_09125 [Burkholderiales bacterium]|nr:hypothetical protein [Nitrosomonas sp.]MCP5274995.1 hypothetical protein [Burkholderiales bacterium]
MYTLWKKFVCVLFVTILLSGCASVHRPASIFTNLDVDRVYENGCPDCSPFNIAVQIQRRLFEERTPQINPYKFKIGEKILYEMAAGTTTEISACTRKKQNGVITGDLGSREIARNELIGTAFKLANSSISKHLAGIKSTEVNFNLILGAAQPV